MSRIFSARLFHKVGVCMLLVVMSGPASAQSYNGLDHAVPVGRDPLGMTFGPGGQRLYVANNEDNSIDVIDVPSRTRVRTIAEKPPKTNDGCPHNLCRGFGAADVSVTADERYAYVSSMRRNSLVKLDLTSGQIVGAVRVQRFPRTVAVSADGVRAYVMNAVENSVSGIDLNAFRPLGKPIALTGGNAYGFAFGRDVDLKLSIEGERLFVANGINRSIDVFDTRMLSKIGSIPDASANHLLIEPKNGQLIALYQDGIAVYDPVTLEPRQAARFCRNLHYGSFALSPDGRSLALTLPEERRVVVIDRATGLLSAVHQTGFWPRVPTFSPDGQLLAVAFRSQQFDDEDNRVAFFARDNAGELDVYRATAGEVFCQPEMSEADRTQDTEVSEEDAQ